MHNRRALLAAPFLLAAPPAFGQALPTPPRPAAPPAHPAPRPPREKSAFERFLDGVAEEARRGGVSPATLQTAFAGLQPNARVLELDKRQPEFTLTWDQYRDRVLPPQRLANGRQQFQQNRLLLEAIAGQYRVAPGLPVAIWGLETNFGGNTGGFGTIESLATLAYEGRRAEFFRRELMAALRILHAGHVPFSHMRGSWAGAMGQPQFMPTSFERFAVDFDGDGHRNIWDSRADALASIASYLARNGAGWRWGEPWAREVVLPAGFDLEITGREKRRPMQEWLDLGVRAADGQPLPALEAAILPPDGPASTQVFAVFANFNAIRRYNPSNFYALAVGLLADAVSA